jgi:tRNA-2-methylthio-N6-dimethylallyladenosine synthase
MLPAATTSRRGTAGGPVMKRFLIHTFGCQMNAHDSRRIAEVLQQQGYASTDLPEHADLIVLNTCSVREKAEHKLRSALGRLRPIKESRSDMVIAVAGCMAKEHGEGLLDRLDLVDVLIGPDNVPELPALLRQVQDGGSRAAAVEFDLIEPRFLRASADPTSPEITSFVTVMKGCDERCSFCIVPHTRGPERYRAADDIVSEVAALAAGGVAEITLLGQTVNSWHDPTDPCREGESQFPALLRRIAHEVPSLARLRYTSPHPRHVTPELIAAHAELDVLPAHVHLPVQSGSDRLLKRMIRRYTRASYIERARALQAARAGLTLSTDIIVGFPGETNEDFEQTLSLVEEVGFSTAFGFKYSPRPHTPALKLGDDIDEALKSERLARLFELVDRLQRRHLDSLVGSRTRVLIEGPSKIGSTRFAGRSDRHEIAHIDAAPGGDLTGLLLEVRIVAANKRSLLCELEGELPDLPKRSVARRALHLPVVAA